MFGYNFFNNLMWRYCVLMGTLVNQININRYDTNGNVTNIIRVPLTFGPKQKVLTRVQTDPNLNRPFSSILPYMSFEVKKIYFDKERHLNILDQSIGRTNANKNLVSFVYGPATYNIEFELNATTSYFEDGLQIVEQIIPFFQPDWTATLKLIETDEIEVLRDIIVVLDDINFQDNWDGNYDKRQYVEWTFNFTMKAYFFGPINKNRIIKDIKVQFGTSDDNVLETMEITPGLTANGEPTSDPNQTIDWSDIDWTQDYGFIIKKE